MKQSKYPPIEEVENMRWTDNHTKYHSLQYGFCEAHDCCENCDLRIRLLCKVKFLMNKIIVGIIKRHYGIKKGW